MRHTLRLAERAQRSTTHHYYRPQSPRPRSHAAHADVPASHPLHSSTSLLLMLSQPPLILTSTAYSAATPCVLLLPDHVFAHTAVIVWY